MGIANTPNLQDREFAAFCDTSSGDIGKRTCSEVTNTTSNPVPVVFANPENVKITKLTSPATANDSFSHTFTDGTKRFKIYLRSANRLEYNWVNSDFSLVPTEIGQTGLGEGIKEEGITLNSATIYLRVNASSKNVYIEEWY